MIVLSWGFSNPIASNDGLIVDVYGFKFKGTINIKYNTCNCLFDVVFIDNGRVVDEVEGITANTLVNFIDNKIEKVNNYKQRVIDEYSLL